MRLRKFNENTESVVQKIGNTHGNIKVFIVLYCFWEGDGYLVNEYTDCFLTKEDAISFANSLKYSGKNVDVYLPGEEIPDEGDGGYGTPSFAKIIEKVF